MSNSHVTCTKNWFVLKSYQGLKFGDIEGKTESTVVAAEDQVINTNYYQSNGRKKQTDTIGHLTSGCFIVAKNEYLMRHVEVCAHLHYSVRKTLSIETTDKWYTHTHTQTSK